MQVVLVEPQIPQNTGSIARTCAATQTPLHIVGTPGFELSQKTVRRAGLDYWPYVMLTRHSDFESYLNAAQPANIWLFSTHGTRLYSHVSYTENDALVFGSETKGLGQDFLGRFQGKQVLKIPIYCPGVRSLNLSNSVSIALYEALRQQDFQGLDQ